jgi:hypothetical protein
MKTFLLLGRNGEAEPPLLPQVAVDEDNTVETWQEELANSSRAATPLPYMSGSFPLMQSYPTRGMHLSETNLRKLQDRESMKLVSPLPAGFGGEPSAKPNSQA